MLFFARFFLHSIAFVRSASGGCCPVKLSSALMPNRREILQQQLDPCLNPILSLKFIYLENLFSQPDSFPRDRISFTLLLGRFSTVRHHSFMWVWKVVQFRRNFSAALLKATLFPKSLPDTLKIEQHLYGPPNNPFAGFVLTPSPDLIFFQLSREKKGV